MALQVWLPLNGNLNNQGLANVSVTNSGATVNSAGKIGSCYAFTESQYMVLNNVPFSQLGNCSVCFWIYLASNESWLPCTGGSAGSNTGQYFLATEGGTGAFYHSNIGSNTKTIYRDGVVGTAPLASGAWHHYCITGLDLSSWSGLTINHYGTYSGWNFNGKLNDFRIYDHCLSPKEVKEISKGLVLHYKLDDPYVEPTVNLITSIGNTVRCSKEENGIRIDWTQSANQGDTYFMFNTSEAIQQNTQYTLSFDVVGFTGTNVRFDWSNIHDSQYQCYIKEGRNTVTFTTGTIVTSFFDDYIIDNTSNFWMGNFQLEKKDHATPYTTSSRSGVPVYDSSGYGRNGTIAGSLTSSTDTARNKFSTSIPAATTITHERALSNDNQEWTCCAWVKSSSIVSGSLLNDFNAGNMLKYGTYPLLYLNYGTNDYYNYGNKAIETGVWQHVAFVFKNGTVAGAGTASDAIKLIYINGVNQTNTGGPNKTNTPNSIKNTVTLFGGSFEGLASDYREYCTALSADDIKELYDTSAIIYNDGTIAAREFSEEGTSENITKTGIVKVGNLVELAGNTLVLSDGSLWVRLLHHNNPSSYMFTSSNCWHKTDDANLYSVLDLLRSTAWANSDGEYEFLFCEKLTSSSTEQQFRWKQTSNPALSSTLSGYQLISGNPGRTIGIMNKGFAAAMHNGDSFWCECGAYSGWNGGIAAVTGAVTTGYFDLYVRLFGPTIKGADANLCQFYENSIVAKEIIEI